MAIKFQTSQGSLGVPGAYSIIKVQSNPSGLAANGILAVIGEADGGLDFASETDFTELSYGPDRAGDIQSKYISGPLVDSYLSAVAASNDSEIPGSFTTFIPVKVNRSTKATANLLAIGGGTWAKISDKNLGKPGNLISHYVTQKQAEAVPTTGSLLVAPPQVSTVVDFRVNGGAVVTTTISAGTLPSAIVTAINGLTGVAASGGVNRAIVTAVAGSLTVVVDSGRQIHINITSATFAATPSVGDILYIPTGSPMATSNEGTYVVTAATSSRIDCYKILDAAGSGAAITTPTAEGPVAIAATTDIQAFSPVVISNEAGAVIAGFGKSLEIAQSGSNDIGNNLYVFGGASASPPVSAYGYVSKSGSAKLITSATEYQVTFNIGRQTDNITETIDSAKDVVFTLGYTGTSGTAVIADGVMTITVVGGSGTSPGAITLANYATINELATYINSLTGFSAAAASAALGQKSPLELDEGTFTIATSWGAKTGRIKANGQLTLGIVNDSSVLVDLAPVTTGDTLIGLPDVSTISFLSGGTRGATTNADIAAGLTALEEVFVNFIVPAFSQNATLDIAAGKTDSGSTYDIESINASVLSHVLTMSKLQERKPRQAGVSFRGTYTNAKAAASNLSSSRLFMTFQDIKDLDSTNTIVQQQPWCAAVKAASMQLGGFYKGLVGKYIKCSGALQAAGDFKNKQSVLTECLENGLNPIVKGANGGFKWVSDQTTYTKDENPVYNSIQATYIADVVAQTVSQRMEQAFLGKNVGDISAPLALTTLDGIMADMLALKLTAPSDDAPKGFTNAQILINGPALVVSLEIKLDTLIYFIPITFLVTPVTQAAG